MRSPLRTTVGLTAVAAGVTAALSAAATVSSAGRDVSALQVRLGNFACYRATFNGSAERSLTLTDRFGTRRVILGQATTLCAAADVNGRGVPNPNAYFTCHWLKRATRTPAQVLVSDLFGRVTIGIARPQTLCAPSSATEAGKLPSLPQDLDYFTCYSVTSAKGARTRTALVADAFERSEDRMGAPIVLCAPTAITSTSKPRQAHLLTCYALASEVTGRPVVIRSRFTLLKASPGLRDRLCVPSRRP